MVKCEYEGCQQEAKYALYQLNEDFTKRWVQVCDWHDKLISSTNNRIKRDNPDRIFKEVK